MDFKKYLQTNYLSIQLVSRMTGIHANTLSKLKHRQQSPSLKNAIIIHAFTEGQVELAEMLSLPQEKEAIQQILMNKAKNDLNDIEKSDE
ncbi:MAG: hypothetical protein R3230_01305 [Nitrosopumilaceae archaeon]|nr:hypothetical protein [Nitrosopumilaceae archaeon]